MDDLRWEFIVMKMHYMRSAYKLLVCCYEFYCGVFESLSMWLRDTLSKMSLFDKERLSKSVEPFDEEMAEEGYVTSGTGGGAAYMQPTSGRSRYPTVYSF